VIAAVTTIAALIVGFPLLVLSEDLGSTGHQLLKAGA